MQAEKEIERLTKKNETLLSEFNQAMQSSYYIVQGCLSLSKEIEEKNPEVFAVCFSQDSPCPWTGIDFPFYACDCDHAAEFNMEENISMISHLLTTHGFLQVEEETGP